MQVSKEFYKPGYDDPGKIIIELHKRMDIDVAALCHNVCAPRMDLDRCRRVKFQTTQLQSLN